MVLGNLLIWKAKTWEGPVLAVFALVQVFLATMLLGIYVFDVRVGSSPFLLIRELPENIGLPWTKLPTYLAMIPQFKDGRGLNPLLQNYWMVIHPPTLFFGFASTLIPFAFAIAGLWTRRVKEWMEPALPWTFFGIGVLGTGILMGGAWAYEALSFGGFWAWDPVENASLVPWLTLVGTGHLMLINKRKDTSLFTTLFLALLTFLLVLYSTFLTRSGVLGDTSVHSFTGEGMLPGLLIFMLTFGRCPTRIEHIGIKREHIEDMLGANYRYVCDGGKFKLSYVATFTIFDTYAYDFAKDNWAYERWDLKWPEWKTLVKSSS